jgi:NAD(P)-dependent dehydrogenase (short-subunit alcohol dehydrogenase family)
VQADITERAAVERMLAECTANLGPVDILVASAVASVRQTLLERERLTITLPRPAHINLRFLPPMS